MADPLFLNGLKSALNTFSHIISDLQHMIARPRQKSQLMEFLGASCVVPIQMPEQGCVFVFMCCFKDAAPPLPAFIDGHVELKSIAGIDDIHLLATRFHCAGGKVSGQRLIKQAVLLEEKFLRGRHHKPGYLFHFCHRVTIAVDPELTGLIELDTLMEGTGFCF